MAKRGIREPEGSENCPMLYDKNRDGTGWRKNSRKHNLVLLGMQVCFWLVFWGVREWLNEE